MNLKIKKIFSVILSIILVFSINLIAIAENEKSWKNKIDEKIYEEATDKDSVIPVYIWLTDVDHDEVVAETENTLGYGEKDLAVVDEYISDELAVAISNLSEKEDSSVKDELQKYMKKTEKKRKAEKEKTDKYICEKRSNYRDKYNKKSKDFLEKAKISDDEIIFRSQYAPMIIAELTLKQIEKVAKAEEVDEIGFYEKIEAVATSEQTVYIDQLCDSLYVSFIHDNLGITGNNVKTGIVEYDNITLDENMPENRFFTAGEALFLTDKNHSDRVGTVLGGENGVAPKCIVYSSSYAMNDYYGAIEALIECGVKIINASFGFLYNYSQNNDVSLEEHKANNEYLSWERWADHIATNHNLTFVVSAGNDGTNLCSGQAINHRIMAPGMAYNVITVGAYNSVYISSDANDITDDILYDYSSFDNYYGCEKPDLVAPANMEGGGTSVAAPFVSGIIALMLELRPSLAAYPQAIKAILLASCHHKASSSPAETMSQGITDKQGAGVVDAYRTISITGRGNYGVRELSGGAVSTDVKFNVPLLYGAEGINVSIAWLKNNSISSSNHNSDSNVSVGYTHNLDLNVLSGGTSIGTGTKTNSSTEMVYISSPSATTYTARISKVNTDVDTVKVGYAWSFDEEQFQYNGDNEGIYFIKNKQSGNYLNYSSSAGLTQKTFSGSLYQRWVVYKRNNSYYTISNYIGATGSLDVNSLISGKYYSISLDDANTANVSIHQNNEGSVTISKTKNGEIYQLCILDNATFDNAQTVWKRIDNVSDMELTQWWYLEPICYQVGDVDMDGSITAADSRIVLNYSAGTGTLGSTAYTNVLLYLADANSDGQITAADSRLILRFASGLE